MYKVARGPPNENVEGDNNICPSTSKWNLTVKPRPLTKRKTVQTIKLAFHEPMLSADPWLRVQLLVFFDVPFLSKLKRIT